MERLKMKVNVKYTLALLVVLFDFFYLRVPPTVRSSLPTQPNLHPSVKTSTHPIMIGSLLLNSRSLRALSLS